MNVIKEIAKQLNIELNEHFYIQIKENSLITVNKYYLSNKGLLREGDTTYQNEDKFLRMLITGEASIVKKEYFTHACVPMHGSIYWSYSELHDGEISCYTWYNNFADNCRLKLGIVYATKEDALKAKEKKHQEIRNERNNRIAYYAQERYKK